MNPSQYRRQVFFVRYCANHSLARIHTYLIFLCDSKVEVNLLTGETQILAADIVFDCGKSLNPAVDLGQVSYYRDTARLNRSERVVTIKFFVVADFDVSKGPLTGVVSISRENYEF